MFTDSHAHLDDERFDEDRQTVIDSLATNGIDTVINIGSTMESSKRSIEFAEKYYKQFDFILLSNDVSEWSAYITEFHNLDKYFKCKIVSGDVKCRKPDKCIYEITLERINKKAEECIFVDNSVKNLKIADELNISTILFNRDNEEYNGEIVNSFDELDVMLANIK